MARPKLNREVGAGDNRVIGKELIPSIVSQSIVIVTQPQREIMKLRNVINYSGDGIEAGEVKLAKPVVVE